MLYTLFISKLKNIKKNDKYRRSDKGNSRI